MFPVENLMVIDIETVSRHATWEEMDPRWQDLWAAKIEKQMPEGETPETFYPRRAAILAEFGKVICISMGFFIKQPEGLRFRVKSFAGHGEKEILQAFLDTAAKWQSRKKQAAFAGHNIKEFDIPYLCRRMLVHQLPIPDWFNFQAMKPWETNLEDTMQLWRFGDYKNYTSLNLLAACLDVPSPKEDMDGSMVGEAYWQENRLEDIVAYCQRDVVTVAQLLLRFRQMPLLEQEHVEMVE